ncbi:MAG: hypothetical protein JJE35_10970 [Thermoleophilia bacterium]|nr:hypothetical protein [Thermoleophilia bacterium]
MHTASNRGISLRHVALSAGLLAFLALLALAGRAQGAELLYWDNYGAAPQSIAVANGDGSGGGALNLTGVTLDDPEGMALDTVTGRLYVASDSAGPEGKGAILFAKLDGSGAGVFSAPGAPVDTPEGVVVDPVTRTIYWTNADGALPSKGSIAWAKLDGSAGGTLNTAGATLDQPYKIGLDPVNGRVYWGNNPISGVTISYANVNNTGGGTLSLSPAPKSAYAFAVDPAGGRLYWSEGQDDRFAYTGLLGGSVSILDTSGALTTSSYGFAIDPTLNKISWPNYDNGVDRANGFGFASLGGGGGGNITPVTAPFDGPQDLLVLKSPTGTAAPVLTRAKKARSQLTCSAGTWAGDFAGSYVYQAPTTYAYQWTRNGSPLAGASAASFTAKTPGKYACVVTATNQAGAASQTSAAANVKASKAKLTVKKKVTVKAGGVATFKLKVANQGDLKSKNAKACAKVPKSAKGELKAPKCKSLGKLKSGRKKSATLKIKTTPSAAGVYKVTFSVKGSAGKPVKSKIQVLPAP